MSAVHMANTLAKGLFAEWCKARPADRRAMVRQAYHMEPGPERIAMLKFLRLVADAQARGEA